MDVNLTLGVNLGSGRRADRPGSLIRRRSNQSFVEPEFEPKVEWIDKPEALILVADLPGFKKEDVKVQLDAWGNIIISGERCVEEMIYVAGVWYPRQRPGFKFKKIFSIPKNVNTADITARFENEMLHITINKMRPPPENRSTNILDQENKSILSQVGESSGKFIEESKEEKNGKASSNKPNQSLRDEKVETPKFAKSRATHDDQVPSNKLDQSPRDEKVKNLEAVKFSAIQDEKVSINKHDQSPRDENVETTGFAKSSTTQDDKALSNKLDQSSRDEKVEILGVTKSTTTLHDKATCNKLDQSRRDEKDKTPEVAKSSVAQDDKASRNKLDQSPRDEKIEISEVTKSSVAQLDDEKLETPEVAKSSTIQDAIQMETQLEASKKLEELAKHPSSLNEENIVDSNTLPKKFELLDSNQEVEMKVGDQHEHKLVENLIVKSNPPHEDYIQKTKVSSPKAKKEDNSSNWSHMKDNKGEEEKKSIFKAHPYVSQFISSRGEFAVVVSIIVFYLALYITYILTYSED